MERPTCRTCPYFDGAEEDGQCHRNPPQLPPTEKLARDLDDARNYDGGMWQGVWPYVSPSDWCGEHPRFDAYLESERKRGTEAVIRWMSGGDIPS